jgi:hypothetical protein
MQVEEFYSPPSRMYDSPKRNRGVADNRGCPIRKWHVHIPHEYSPEFLKVDVRRKQLGNRLLLNGGGLLGIQCSMR